MANAGQRLAERFSEFAGREDQYDVREVEGADGTRQTQLIDKDSGSVSFAVNGDFDPETVAFGGSVGGDAAVNPKEALEEDAKPFRTSRGNLASPTQPQALEGEAEPTEIDNTDKGGDTQENQTAERTENQASRTTANQRTTRARTSADSE